MIVRTHATDWRAESEDELYRLLAEAASLPFVDLRSYRISGGMLRKIPAPAARSRRCVPMIHNRRRVVLVVDDPALAFDLGDCEKLAEALEIEGGREIEFALAASGALDSVLERYDSFP